MAGHRVYFPFHLSRAIRAQKGERLPRPIEERDLGQARRTAQEVLARFPKDWAWMVRVEIRTALLGAAVPLAGALFLDWPLWLLALSLFLDGLAVCGIEMAFRPYGERFSRPMLDLALRTEQALQVAAARPPGGKPIPLSEVDPGQLQSLEKPLLVVSLIGALLLLQPALEEAGALALLCVLAGSLASRALEARERLLECRAAESAGTPPIQGRPRSPESLLRLFLMLGAAAFLYHVVGWIAPFRIDGRLALLYGYLLATAGLAGWWWYAASRGRRRLHGLLSESTATG